MEPAAQARLDALRAAHFPPERNFLAAHLTLFHALPGEEEEAVSAFLRTVTARTPPPMLHFPGLRFLGRGVAVGVEAPALLAVRAELATAWHGWLTAQDQQKWRPHVHDPEQGRARGGARAPRASRGGVDSLWNGRGVARPVALPRRALGRGGQVPVHGAAGRGGRRSTSTFASRMSAPPTSIGTVRVSLG